MVDQQEQDRMLPIANVGRIMKQILPPTAKISKEAKQTMQECATEFISFVTGEASDKCHKENRKTVNGDDICWALTALGFDNYAEVLVRYLHKYREAEREKANQISKGSDNNNNNNHITIADHDEDKDGDSDDRSKSTTGVQQTDQISNIITTSPTLMEFNIIEKGDHHQSLVKSS
ncbi:Nuclear transcription factor Y subunit B-4 [Morus notabilis]|uniref:Nuclear transcription factor Y subunit B-4 n=1 Tax=Morus notabilis TaxID=981085 RepID=W9QH19_9ROSA|nr:nuclear transcription factor Y subunit B-4 [Morus notabilis]EXB37169.1 Nuclear transcription factor Y subunit B-4 [Morus notabilis]